MSFYFRFAKSKFSEKCQEEKLAEIATFMNRVMLPRLGESFIQPVSLVELPHDQLQVTVVELPHESLSAPGNSRPTAS